jgi:GNAT superfamily N-acetyltransferase
MASHNEWHKNGYRISTDRTELDLDVIYDFISQKSYWGAGRPRKVIFKSVQNSLCFGIYKNDEQVGFARVVTDYATFAWVADVFVVEAHRGKGLSKWVMQIIITHPDLQGFRRWALATKDAHDLYKKYGFTELLHPERWMERHDPTAVEKSDYWNKK